MTDERAGCGKPLDGGDLSKCPEPECERLLAVGCLHRGVIVLLVLLAGLIVESGGGPSFPELAQGLELEAKIPIIVGEKLNEFPQARKGQVEEGVRAVNEGEAETEEGV